MEIYSDETGEMLACSCGKWKYTSQDENRSGLLLATEISIHYIVCHPDEFNLSKVGGL